MKKHTVVLLAVVLSVVMTWSNAWAKVAYTIIDLGTLDGYDGASHARSINNLGQVVGYSSWWIEWPGRPSGGEPNAVLWEEGGIIDLGTVDDLGTVATGINDSGQIVGHSVLFLDISPQEDSVRGLIWEEGVMTDLGDLGAGESVEVGGINDRGQVVGSSYAPAGNNHAFLWENGMMTDLGLLGTSGQNSGKATCINNFGEVAGYADTVDQHDFHAFLITPEDRNGDGIADTWFRDDDLDGINDLMRDLGTLGGRLSRAWGINDFGQVVGSAGAPGQQWGHACLWEDGVPRDLGEFRGRVTVACGINDSGQIVGHADSLWALIWEDGIMVELTDLLPSNSGWSYPIRAEAINDFGWIVGSGIISDEWHAFLMAPVLTHTPCDVTQSDVDSIRFIFGNSMDDTSFSVEDDILSFTGPEGPLTATGYSWLDSHTLDVTFEPQTVQGVYTLELGPTILDSEGRLLDLDGDLVFDETPDDVYYASFKIDTTHPRVVHHIPNGDVAGTVDHIEVLFSETIESRTFWVTQSDVRITGPNSVEITPLSITSISDSRFQISFAPQSDLGEYIVEMGPDVADFAGNLLDQDRNGMGGEDPNDVYQATFNLVDVDLTLSNVMADPNILWAGEEFTVSWNGSNQSGMPLLGEWTDAAYLSVDDKWDIDDKLIATITHTGGLAEDEVYSQSITEPVPGALPGDYYIIVRADLYNQEKEAAGEGNNVVALGPFPLGVRQLSTDGTPVSGTLAGVDRLDYYGIDLGEGEYLGIILSGLAPNTNGEVFASYEAIPTRMKYDQRSAIAIQGTQQVVIPAGPGGTYYVLVYGDQLDGSSPYELTASASEIIITDITPEHHGIDRVCTMTISGGGFDEATTVDFVGSSVRTPTDIRILSPTTMVVTLDLPSWPVDVYDVVVSKPGVDPYGISDAFEVTTGVAHLETHLVVPSRMGRTWRQTIWIEYANTGDSSMPSPLLKLDGTEDHAMLTLDPSLHGLRTNTPPPGVRNTVQIMATGSGATPGILQPGDSGRIPVYFLGLKEPWDWSDWSIEFGLGVLTAEETEPVDWPTLKEELQPSWLGNEAWDAIWLNFTEQVGATWGGYVVMLGENMTYLSQAGVKTNDVIRLLAFEFRQADSLCPLRYLAEATDTAIYVPGGQLEFTRVYAQPISRRYELGPLGRGWAHLWQMYLQKTQDGIVKIFNATGTPRVFLPNSWGGYTSKPGDTGVLTEIAGVSFTLKEKDGSSIVFHYDGKLDFTQDRNGNRITAGYNGDLLTSLNHSNGKVLLLDYNGNGRIWHVNDPRGDGPEDDHVITYEYDASGEHLVSVNEPGNRVTSYTYDTGNGLQREHALLSIEYTDGKHDYFSYDAQGRLIETYKDGGAESVTYSYDSAGTVTVEDATGRYTTTCFGAAGHALRIFDGERNVTSLKYDITYQLTNLIGGSGQRYGYSYDDQGDIVGIDDPLHNLTTLTYEPVYKRLSLLRDARGQKIQCDYDDSGNLTSITYEDNTSELFTYDSIGNVLTWTNRRGDTVTYTYDSAGRPTVKDYPDTPDFNDYTYTYDEASNLISATDPCGTTTLTYDPNTDWLTRINYPGGYFFIFEYDDVGRRTQRTDQDGNVVKYIYDIVGRLDQMTDVNDILIVDYDYDAAGRLTRKTLGNGVYTTYDYDAVGRVIHLVNCTPSHTIISRFDYTYDASSRRTSMTTLDGVYTYGYDPLGQLISVTYPDGRLVKYVYDAVGNRVKVIDDGVEMLYTTNNMNQYTNVNGVIFTYDDDGNMNTKTEGSATTTYTYDVENRLVGVSTPNDTWTYTYNAFGNRIASTHNGGTTNYIIDLIGLGNVAAEYGDSNNLIARYDHGLGLISRTENTSLPAYYSFDALGSTSELTDTSGLVVNSYSYDPFGNLMSKSETVNNPFGFVGKYGVMCEDNGLNFMRARFCDPRLGHFLSADPIGLLGGDVTLYCYVWNSPTGSIDPQGTLGYSPDCGKWERKLQPLIKVGDLEINHHYAVSKGWRYDFNPRDLKDYLSEPGLFSSVEGEYSRTNLETGERQVLGHSPYRAVTPWGPWQKNNCIGATNRGWFCPWTKDPCDPPDDPNAPPTKDGGSGRGRIPRPARDPNKKIGPKGAGSGNFILADDMLAYQIQFENMSDAGSPAHKIVITDALDEDLDLSTFELTEIVFANHTIVVPEGLNYYQTIMDIVVDNEFISETKLRVDIDVSLDLDTRVLTCTLMGIDPNTGWLPEDIMLGILYPNDETGRGDGHISFNVKPLAGLPSGTEITNKASIKFDWNDPINTPLVLNTLDTAPPVSEVNSLPSEANDIYLLVSWSGQDDPNGSGIASYDIYVSDNNSVYEVWLDGTNGTSATFIGEHGHTYSFYIVATDNVGHMEDVPTVADVTITLYDHTAPRIVTAIVNEGQSQRSTIGTLAVQFSENLVVDKDILTLYNDTNCAPVDLSVLTASDFSYDANTYTAMWDLSPVTIEDGNHTATVLASAIIDTGGNYLDGDGDGIGGDDYTFDFHRLFGDFDGSENIDFTDFATFAEKWQNTACAEPYWCDGADSEPDGDVDIIDLAAFVDRWLLGM